MEVYIVELTETKDADAVRCGPAQFGDETFLRLIEWCEENSVPPDGSKTFGMRYTIP